MISDKSVEKLLGELSVDIAQRTPGTGDFPTAVEGLELFRRNEPAPPVSCLVPPSLGMTKSLHLRRKSRRIKRS